MSTYTHGNPGVVAGNPGALQRRRSRIKTIDTGYAKVGRLVMRDTDDNHCKVAGAGEATCWGFIMPPGDNSDLTADFTTETEIVYGHGPVLTTMYLTTGQTAVKGVDLYPAAHGALKTTATAAERPVAKAEESVTTSTLAEDHILVRYQQ